MQVAGDWPDGFCWHLRHDWQVFPVCWPHGHLATDTDHCLGPYRYTNDADSNRMLLSQHNDDVIKWKHFPRYRPFVRGIHRSPVNSPHKGQWRGALMFSLICTWINGWVNNGEAGDFIRHRAHYDVTVMDKSFLCFLCCTIKQGTGPLNSYCKTSVKCTPLLTLSEAHFINMDWL